MNSLAISSLDLSQTLRYNDYSLIELIPIQPVHSYHNTFVIVYVTSTTTIVGE
jgi:hypothetical protein